MRQVIISVAGIAIIAIGYLGMKTLSASKKTPEKALEKSINSVYTSKVENKLIPIMINTSGSVLAKDRMVIYSEVQGVFQYSSKSFKAGVNYRKGESLIKVNNEEYIASVVAQRSSFKNLLTSILADVKFDYPTSLAKWERYLSSIDIEKNLPQLPEIEVKQERNYITGKNIFSTFYNIKNLEVRLRKYTISAPYNGVLVEALVTPGTLISQGQQLGVFIKENVFELELNINSNLQDFLKIGTLVELTNISKTKSFNGQVVRVNPQIDRSSQTIKIFVEIKSTNLKEGEYLEANIYAKDVGNAIEIPRELLVNNNSLYVVKRGKLKLIPVQIVYENINTVVIEGLANDLEYVSKSIANAYEGMSVKVIED